MVRWSRADGRALSRRITETREGYGTEIEITNVEPEDEGTYRCTASNGFIDAYADIRLVVQCKCVTLNVTT